MYKEMSEQFTDTMAYEEHSQTPTKEEFVTKSSTETQMGVVSGANNILIDDTSPKYEALKEESQQQDNELELEMSQTSPGSYIQEKRQEQSEEEMLEQI